LQNSPLESSCVVFALIENYSTSNPLIFSPEKSQIMSCATVVVTLQWQMSDEKKLVLETYEIGKIIICTKPLTRNLTVSDKKML